ncbi:MAG TPA: BACON domain-containing carbohydrate-binding protein [Vicinamibacterales bacterium]|nr:BACON domain-containing carbohydrate-binding protein [Vicinamibacterales bacterium]
MRIRCFTAALLFTALGAASASCDKSPTNPAPVCSFSVSPGNATFGAEGGAGTATVTTAAGCAWSASTNASWITVTSGSSGSGPGSVGYSVAAHSGTDVRSGGLTIAGQTHGITQQGRPVTICTYEISPGEAEFEDDAATGSFTVSAAAGCSWNASSNASWLVVTAGAEGSGNGTVAFTVARNFEVTDRTGAISVAGRAFAVRQSGDIGACQYSVAPVEFNPCMPGGSVTATITTQASCPWTASTNSSWLGLPGGEAGSGTATITLTFGDNYDAPRDGMVMVRWPTPTAGQNIRVAQAGCVYGVSRVDFAFAAGGGSGSFDVVQQSVPNACGGATQDRCVWTAQSDVPWITITTSMPRSGDNPVAFTVAPNAGASRAGRITVRDKVVTITQAGL